MVDWDNKNNRNKKHGITYEYIDIFHLIIMSLLSENMIQNELEHLFLRLKFSDIYINLKISNFNRGVEKKL